MPNQPSAGGAVINLLQITDSHLTKDAEGELLGVNTRESLRAVLGLVKANIAERNHAQPDCILATGDLAQDASPEAYHCFKSQIDDFGCPSNWFPGNHDDREVMRDVIGSGPELDKIIRIEGWQIIMLDSSVTGAVHGFLEKGELDILESALSERPDLHSLVCMHHHPVSIDSEWLDKIGVHNRDAFFEVIDRHKNVRAVLWGHIHQQLDDVRDSISLHATPSTCIQFLPKSKGFAVESIAPGYRWMSRYPNGDIKTKVERAVDYVFNLELESAGY